MTVTPLPSLIGESNGSKTRETRTFFIIYFLFNRD